MILWRGGCSRLLALVFAHWGSRQNGKKGFSSMVRNGTAMLLGKLKKMNQRHIQYLPYMWCDKRLGVGMLNSGDVDAHPEEI